MSTTEVERFLVAAPMLLGHRGLGRGTVDGHAENTVTSMLAALDAGADGLEVDVARTADGVLVVSHDPALPDGRFLVDVGAGEATAAGLVRLADLLDTVPAGVPVDLDLKSVLEDATDAADRRTDALLAPMLAAEIRRRPVLVTSFDPAALLRLREAVPAAAYGLLSWVDFPLRHAVAAAAGLGLDLVGLHHGSFGPNRVEGGPVHRPSEVSVELAHRAGLRVLAWCPEPDVAAGLVTAGVDAVVVNDIPAAVARLSPPSGG
jgi:glycerophosphoryl diester phosphodiesterase